MNLFSNFTLLLCFYASNFFQKEVSATLSVNEEGAVLTDPTTVGADSDLIISSLQSKDPEGNTVTFKAGDCLQIQFSPIDQYEQIDPGAYAPIPKEITTCSFNLKAKCDKQNNFQVQITLEEEGTSLAGRIGKLKNPYSAQTLVISMIRYYSKCSSMVDQTAGGIPLTFDAGSISVASISTSITVVGASGQSNVVTFAFTPGTRLATVKGAIAFRRTGALTWYNAGRTRQEEYADKIFRCSSNRIQSIDSGSVEKTEYVIRYTGLKGPAADPITITCQGWRNPIVPQKVSDWVIETRDGASPAQTIDISAALILDASAYTPYQIPDSAITFDIASSDQNVSYVQTRSAYTISFVSAVPFEIDGCYVKYTFPRELQVSQATLDKIDGSGMLLNPQGQAPLKPFQFDITGPVKYVVFQGCKNALFQADRSKIQQQLTVKYYAITNPFAARQTSPFIIEIYKNWSQDRGFYGKIIESLTARIPASKYTPKPLRALGIEADNTTVQELPIYTVTIDTSSTIPGSGPSASSTYIKQAFHINYPNTLTQNPASTDANPFKILGVTNSIAIQGPVTFSVDNTPTYSDDCVLNLCHLVYYQTAADIAPNTIQIIISNLQNPLSLAPGNSLGVSSLIQYSDTYDSRWYLIDTLTSQQDLKSTPGALYSVFMKPVEAPLNTNNTSTYAANQVYTLKMRTTHLVPRGGYIRVALPPLFDFSSQPNAIAMFSVQGPGNAQYASVHSVDADKKFIQGILRREMPKQTDFFIRLGGIINPRIVIKNSLLPFDQQQNFNIQTFDASGYVHNNLIDEGAGGAIDIDIISPMDSFSASNDNTTNGVATRYVITFFTQVLTQNTDILVINFPPESTLVPGSNYNLTCSGLAGIVKINCYQNKVQLQQLIVELTQITQPIGMYKFDVENIRNPPSLRGSSRVQDAYQTNSNGALISRFFGTETIGTDFASLLQGLGSANITQSSKEYGEASDYEINFQPYSILNQNSLSLTLQYPATVAPLNDKQGCTIQSSVNSKTSDCVKVSGANIFSVTNAIPAGYSGPAKIKISLRNPYDNWGEVGFKIRTQEVTPDGSSYFVDTLEGNQLIPNLKCYAPCELCYAENSVILNMNYCTKCWQNSVYKYLQQGNTLDPKTTGIQTCLSSCDSGYTSNGDELHKCEKCDATCASCQDNGDVGDKFKCLKCSDKYPYMYSPFSQCMVACDQGFYQVSKRNCDKCSYPCALCAGDKFNCTKCDLKGSNRFLLVSQQMAGTGLVTRGNCRQDCPMGYFQNLADPGSYTCDKCTSPCATCAGSASTCLSCNGDQNKTYIYNGECYKECPVATAPDMSTQQCVNCGPHCDKCGTLAGDNCYQCEKTWLLQDGVCVLECTKPGYFANKQGTICINKTEFPTIGPIFTIASAMLLILCLIVKKLKSETQVIPSIIAVAGVLQFILILFQIYITLIFKTPKYLYFSLFAIGMYIILNIWNFCFLKINVANKNATTRHKLSYQEVKHLYDEQVARDKRRKRYDERFDEEGNLLQGVGKIKVKNNDETKVLLAGQMELSQDILYQNGIEKDGNDYYLSKVIEDKGLVKWMNAYPRTSQVIQWIGLIISFKFYRLTYSFFMARKQFLVLYQKKKFKKNTVVLTILSQFFVELPIIICDAVGLASIPFGQQLFWTILDSLMLSVFLIIIEFVEIAKLDKIMRTVNSAGHMSRKSAAACESSQDDDAGLSDNSSSEDDDYPDWRMMLKNVEGNPHLFKKTPLQLQLNKLEKRFNDRQAESCIEFPTGKEEGSDIDDARNGLNRSFPTSPKAYKEFNGINPSEFGPQFDNVYADAKEPAPKKIEIEYSEMGTQSQFNDVGKALARKGGNLLTPGVDKDDYRGKKNQKKKRGRKNKYYKQIDAEDDEEADQMTEGEDEDGLDGIKEEDEEDEEERQAKIAKQKAELQRAIAQEKAQQLQKEVELKQKAELEAKKRAELEAKKKADEQKKLEDERKKAENEQKLQAEKDKLLKEQEEQRKLKSQQAKENKQKQLEDNQLNNNKKQLSQEKLHKNDDAKSDNSNMFANTANLKNFGSTQHDIVQIPPDAETRKFNECDIIGNLERDEKGNVISEQDMRGEFVDKEGRATNQRGYLVKQDTGDIINNFNGEVMFKFGELDEKGEVPAPFSIEKYNFNPHLIRGDFEYDRNGKAVVNKTKQNTFADKKGSAVSSKGYRLGKDGSIVDHNNRQKLSKNQATPEGDLPRLFNYNGRRFDILDVIGIVDKDAKGNIMPQTDQNGDIVDNYGRRINTKGYLIDKFGNVINKDGKQIFDYKHLKEDEIPKIFPFTKFSVKNILGEFETDPLGNAILESLKNGQFIDGVGQKVNQKGYLVDEKGNVINKHGKIVFERNLLDNEGDIPKVYRTGLLKSDSASSLSRLMSEIGKNQSEFDQEEQRIQQEIDKNLRKRKRGNSGNTSVDSMMEDTPANYNYQNQRFDPNMEHGDNDMEDDQEEIDEEEDQEFAEELSNVGYGQQKFRGGVQELPKKKKKKKKKKVKRRPVEFEDPSLREHLLAGAYGGVAKPKPKRQGVKYTTDISAGLRDIATPASAFMRDASKNRMLTSFSGFQNVGNAIATGVAGADSSRGRNMKASNRIQSGQARSEVGSNMGSKVSKIGGKTGTNQLQISNKLLDPQQREEYLKKAQMEEILRKANKAKKTKVGGKAGRISKDADFEKMFGKDIDEFLEASEWDIDSIDKMSQFSKGSKNTIRSANNLNKLKSLEKVYLQRIDNSINKGTPFQQQSSTSQIGKVPKQPVKKVSKLREFQDRYVDDPSYIARGTEDSPQR